jgi:hypothetical protein
MGKEGGLRKARSKRVSRKAANQRWEKEKKKTP